MSENVEVSVNLKFRHKTLVAGRHTFIIPFPDGCAELIGEIIIYWGAFEVRMDALMAQIFEVSGKHPNPNWKKKPFEERKKLFRKVVETYTEQMFPKLTGKFAEILDIADNLQIQRNIVAHGYYETLAGIPGPDGVATPRIVAFGSKQRKSIEVNEETLSQLWHDISHLVGELMACVNIMGGVFSGNDIIIADNDFIGLPETAEPKPITIRTIAKDPKKP